LLGGREEWCRLLMVVVLYEGGFPSVLEWKVQSASMRQTLQEGFCLKVFGLSKFLYVWSLVKRPLVHLCRKGPSLLYKLVQILFVGI
jgi:hypothetical protein